MVKGASKLVQNVLDARKDLEAIVCSFTSRYEVARNQFRNNQQVDIRVEDLQKDLKQCRIQAARLLRDVATLENAIEDLL